MSSLLKIETEQLANDIRSIDEQIGLLKNYVAELRNAEAQLEASWEGDASYQFSVEFEKDCAELEEVIKLISSFKTRLTIANREYTITNGEVSSLINSMNI